MKQIKVLGHGCAKCSATVERIKQVAAAQGVTIELEKIEDMAKIVACGVMSTPAVMLDGKLVHSGGIPDPEKIAGWLAA